MQDLHIINKLNAEAIERSIPQQLAAGRTVVAEYAGLHFVGYETFSGENAEAEAQAKADEIASRGYTYTAKILRPEPVAA